MYTMYLIQYDISFDGDMSLVFIATLNPLLHSVIYKGRLTKISILK